MFVVRTTGSIKGGVSAGPAAPCCVQARCGTGKHTRGNKLVLLSARMLRRKGGEAQWKLNAGGGEESRESAEANEEEEGGGKNGNMKQGGRGRLKI